MNVLVWYRRDLRVVDHPALTHAAGLGAVLPLYVIDPSYWAGPDVSGRQWAICSEALADVRAQLAGLGAPLVVRVGAALAVIAPLCKRYGITRIVAHHEVGHPFDAAQGAQVAAWARDQGIIFDMLDQPMTGDALPAPALTAAPAPEGGQIPHARALRLADDPCPYRQIGGRAQGLALLDSFIAHRRKMSRSSQGDPLLAERACARLSPHLATGALSRREVALAAPSLAARLLRRGAGVIGPTAASARLNDWTAGATGLPFLDANMRYLQATGWLAAPMRAMVIGAAVQYLGLAGAGMALARRLTDYDAGIHWAQVDLAGQLAPHLAHPVKQGLARDAGGVFTRRWVPELATVPDQFLQSPWKWDGARRILGRSYPEAMVDLISPAPARPRRQAGGASVQMALDL